MKYKINNTNEIPNLLNKVKSYLSDFLENNGMLDDYDKYPAEDVVMIMFKNVMDLETCFKLINLLEYYLEEIDYFDPDQRLWWFLNYLAWDVDKERVDHILALRYSLEEKEKISDLVTEQIEDKEKKRI